MTRNTDIWIRRREPVAPFGRIDPVLACIVDLGTGRLDGQGGGVGVLGWPPLLNA